MERTFFYGVMGCFFATLFSLFLNNYQSNQFLLILLPMWGMILSVAVARVVDIKENEENMSIREPKKKVLYQRKSENI